MPFLIWLILGGGVFYVATKAATPKKSAAPSQRGTTVGGGPRVQVASVARVQMRKHGTAKNSQVWAQAQRRTGEGGNLAEAERAKDQLSQKINETSNPIERIKFQRAYAQIDNWRARIANEKQIYDIPDALLDPAIEDTKPTDWRPSARTRIEASHQARFIRLNEDVTNPCATPWGQLAPMDAAHPKWVGGRSPVPVRGATPGTGSNVIMENVMSFYRGLKNIWIQGIRNLQYRGQTGSPTSTGPNKQPFGYAWSSSGITPAPPAGGGFTVRPVVGAPVDDTNATEPNIRKMNS